MIIAPPGSGLAIASTFPSRLSRVISATRRFLFRNSTPVSPASPSRAADRRTDVESRRRLCTMDPNHHSGGRWLHQDRLHREARTIRFDFHALSDRVIRLCPKETEVINCEKIEGGFNRSFIFTLDGGSKLVARLPTAAAGPSRLTTNSEVATMEYLRSKTSIPIPKVLEWNDDPTTPVGAEYIIMEYVAGVRLSDQWDSMDTLQRLECTKNLTMLLKGMADIEFSAYGCLYFAGAPLADNVKVPLSDNYCIGPYCAPSYWKRGVGDSLSYGDDTPDSGPWNNLHAFCDGLIKTGLSRLPKRDHHRRAAYQGSVSEHVRLLHAARAVIAQLADSSVLEKASTPLMLHPDFHRRNVFVSEDDPTTVTGVIDWTSTAIQPAFMYGTDTPDFASLPEDLPFLKGFGERHEQGEFELKAASICAQTFDVIVKGYVPKLQAARNLDPALSRIFLYSLSSWTSSATAIREELFDLSLRWEKLGLEGSCSFSMSDEEIATHKKLCSDLEDAAKLKAGIMRILGANPDGYVPNDGWKSANEALPSLREQWIASAVESGTDEEDAKAMFPFDGC